MMRQALPKGAAAPPTGQNAGDGCSGSPSAEAQALRLHLAEQLVRMGQGDAGALKTVYAATSGRLNALLMRMLQDKAAAEEVLQDVYVALWRHSASFTIGRASPMSWLLAIARNKAIDRMRKDRNWTIRAQPLGEHDPPDPSPTGLEQQSVDMMHARLFLCLDRLEPQHQKIIRSAYFDGLTYPELSQKEGVAVGTLKSWVRRGLIRLRGCLDE